MTNIYLITNTKNNIVYVGKTKNDIFQRFVQHLYNSYKLKKNAANIISKPLYVFMRKVGQENFRVSLLETCNNNIASIRESYWINQYPNNCNAQHPFPFTKEQLADLIKTKSTREIAKEYNIKDHSSIVYLMRKYGLCKPNYYKCYSSLTKEKLYEEYIINKKSISQIANEYNVLSENTIKQRLKKYNIKTRTASDYYSIKYPNINYEYLYNMYVVQKKSLNKIAIEIGVKDHHVVRRLLNKYNISRP